ncbi:hypothetical protein ZIOFF_006331 [Zingiber officinale]|uniref:Uncharacterized protein n=1 Tax=Zingiber officinale TaxID=94328 RepID=A0A8J5IBP3_ZINOF|nr:hypothetical protein ZIOFF_006331 [Zingiber officinale]
MAMVSKEISSSCYPSLLAGATGSWCRQVVQARVGGFDEKERCSPFLELRKKTYIVHMAKAQMPAAFAEHSRWYDASLRSVSDTAEVLYTYDTVAHGFCARLTPAEARALEDLPGVLAVHPEVRYELHTTRTPEFLHLDRTEALIPQSNTESDVIVGVLDTGVWPESRSYDDAGFGPVPASWRGECVEAKDFTAAACNRKLVGAQFFSKGYEAATNPIDESKESKSPRDDDGHGTHTSSTAAGSTVAGANLLGYAAGTARGMSTRARIAVYKVCWLGGCFSSDILAAMDKAVDDGCGVLSLSLGGGTTDYFRDSIAIGAFNAVAKGVVVSCSAGNGGPSSSTLSNEAPWITTVGAGTIDRDFPAYAVLGNGKNLTGVSLYSGKPLSSSPYPFIYAGNATNATNGNLCMQGTLLPDKIQAVSRKQNVTCDNKTIYSVSDLNYPSFSVAFETASGAGGGGSSKTTTVKHKRTLTNVGAPGTYKVTVSAPEEVSVEVYPQELSFASSGERKSYTVSFSAASQPSGSAAFGRLVWSDGQHVVASPLAFTWT